MSDIDKKIAEIEKSVEEHRALFLDPESRNLEYADIVWLIKKLKAYREERGLPPKIEDLSHTIEFEDVDEQD